MALMETLQDSFNDNTRDAGLWNLFNTNTSVTEAGGVLTFVTSTTNGYGGYTSGITYDLTGSYALTQLLSATGQSLVSMETFMVHVYDSGNVNGLFWYLNQNTIAAFKRVGSSNTNLASVSYDPTIHKWFRIRESGGITYWDYSKNGVEWINFFNAANPITVTALFCEPSVGTFSNEATTGTVIMDNVNKPPLLGQYRHNRAPDGLSVSEVAN